MTETWLPVPGWPGYEVSDHGRVRSVDRTLRGGQFCAGRMLAQRRDRKGYWVADLRDGERRRTVRVHVLVAAAFIGPRPAGMQVLHADDDKSRNFAWTIRYGTNDENTRERSERKGKKRDREEKNSQLDRVPSPVTPATTVTGVPSCTVS